MSSERSVKDVFGPYTGFMERAVGIENKNQWNFKDLRGRRRNTKLLKRNDEECTGILIAPSKLPRISSIFEILTLNFSTHSLRQMSASGPRFAARMASRL